MKYLGLFIVTFLVGSYTAACNVHINSQSSIVVTQGSTELESTFSVINFGKVEVNKSKTLIFKIQNIGKKSLKLTGSPTISIQGEDTDFFSVASQPDILIKENEWTTFHIKLSPTVSKFYEAQVVIPSNDSDDDPFTFAITGRGVIIDIEVWHDSTPILNDTGLFSFDDVYLGNTGISAIFTIENIGTSTLDLTDSPRLFKLQGSGASDFIIDESLTKGSLEPNETTSFRVIFNPKSGGVKSAKVIFENSDPDENPYNFTVRGTCLDPEIQVLDPDDKDIPNITGEYVFPDNYLYRSRLHVFTIKNLGQTNLYLTGSPIVELTGANSSAFTVTDQPEATVTSLSETKFAITFRPTFEAMYSATVTIKSNDENENPFVFTIRGLGYETKFDFNGDGFDDVIISSGTQNDNSTEIDVAYLFFGGEDYPKSLQTDNADVVFTLHEKQDFIFPNVAAAGDVNGDGYDDILIGNDAWKYSYTNRGHVLIFFGSSSPPSSFDYFDADVFIRPTSNLDFFGRGLSSVGDFNNDGIDDFMVGAHIINDSSKGSAFLFLGRRSWDSNLSSSKADMMIFGSIEKEGFGLSISGAGDFNKDGYDDVIIGAYPTGIGYAYIFFGESNPPKTKNSIDADVTMNGEKRHENYGSTVSKAGDFNNDGYDDVIVGAPTYDGTSHHKGCAYIYFGSQNPKSTIAPLDADIRIISNNWDSWFASCVSNAGDVNNDGIDDIIISENISYSDMFPKNANVYIFYGRNNPGAIMGVADADVQIDAGKSSFQWNKKLSSAGDFNGDRIDDVFFSTETNVNFFYGRTRFNNFYELTDSDIEIHSLNSDIFIGRTLSGGN